MGIAKSLVTAALAHVGRLRFPTLFVLCAAVFIADLFIPDIVPMADEILLGLMTAGLAAWRDERGERKDAQPQA